MARRYKFKTIDWLKFRQFMGYAFDLGRIFPIIIKQSGIAKFLAGISAQFSEVLLAIWYFLLNLDLQLKIVFSEFVPKWFADVWMNYLSAVR
jgi:hypothetical protein